MAFSSPPRPILNADFPLEELVLPEFSGTWRQPSSDAHLRIFRQGKMIFFVGEIVAGSNATTNIFKTPLPEGWRPNGNYFFPVYSAGTHIMFKIDAAGNLTYGYGKAGQYDWFPMSSIHYLAEN